MTLGDAARAFPWDRRTEGDSLVEKYWTDEG